MTPSNSAREPPREDSELSELELAACESLRMTFREVRCCEWVWSGERCAKHDSASCSEMIQPGRTATRRAAIQFRHRPDRTRRNEQRRCPYSVGRGMEVWSRRHSKASARNQRGLWFCDMPDSPSSAWQGRVEDSRRAEESESSGATKFDLDQLVLETYATLNGYRRPVTPQCGDPTATTPRSGRARGSGTTEAGPKPGSLDVNALTWPGEAQLLWT